MKPLEIKSLSWSHHKGGACSLTCVIKRNDLVMIVLLVLCFGLGDIFGGCIVVYLLVSSDRLVLWRLERAFCETET